MPQEIMIDFENRNVFKIYEYFRICNVNESMLYVIKGYFSGLIRNLGRFKLLYPGWSHLLFMIIVFRAQISVRKIIFNIITLTD